MMITAALLRAVMPLAGSNADVYAPLLSDTCTRYSIDTPGRIAGFLAQIAVESRQLNAVVESCNYRDPARLYALFPHHFVDLNDAVAVQARGEQAIANRIYANRNGNGSEASGDGWNFRGRGLPQITGRHGYMLVGAELSLDLLNHPELLEHPEHAANAAGFWWSTNHLNHYADAGQFQAISAVWNVGNADAKASAIIGFADRQKFQTRALDALKTQS